MNAAHKTLKDWIEDLSLLSSLEDIIEHVHTYKSLARKIFDIKAVMKLPNVSVRKSKTCVYYG